MNPSEFAAKWKGVEASERSASQQHFVDLCRMLGEPTPAEADPTGTWYTFEKPVPKSVGGDGRADVWKRGLNPPGFAAYGWPPDLPDDEVLARLLALNLEREPAR